MEAIPVSPAAEKGVEEDKVPGSPSRARCLDLATQNPKLVNVRIEKAPGGMYMCDG